MNNKKNKKCKQCKNISSLMLFICKCNNKYCLSCLLPEKHNCSFELMHCVSTYPMDDATANLNMINVLKKKFKCNVGYSGHESGLAISIGASAFGLSSLERHITLDRTMYGSDQAASIEPNGLRSLVSSVRKIEKALGDGKKVFLKDEKVIAKKLRAHL